MNSESQHTESVQKIVCTGFLCKKGNRKKVEKGIREKDYSKARNYDTLQAKLTEDFGENLRESILPGRIGEMYLISKASTSSGLILPRKKRKQTCTAIE